MNKKNYIFIFSLSILLSSCSMWMGQTRIFKVKNTQFSSLEESFKYDEHVIAVNDELSLRIFENDAEKIIHPENKMSSNESGVNSIEKQITYRVQKDGNVYLPSIGAYNIAGQTLSQSEEKLRKEYERFINNPFVSLNVVNKKVYVYNSGDNISSGEVIDLTNPNANLIEAVSLAGGFPGGKVKHVYLIRNVDNGVKYFDIDFSEMNNSKYGNIVMQSNDIVYVEPRKVVARKITEEISPFLSLITTLLLVYSLFK